MDGLILIRSVLLSNHVARTQLPEGVVASYHRALRVMAKIALSHLRKSEGYKEPALVEGMRSIIHKISFQRTLKTILKYYYEFYLFFLKKNPPIATLIHLRNQATYVGTTLDTIRIRSATGCRTIRRTTYSAGRS